MAASTIRAFNNLVTLSISASSASVSHVAEMRQSTKAPSDVGFMPSEFPPRAPDLAAMAGGIGWMGEGQRETRDAGELGCDFFEHGSYRLEK